LEQTLVKHPHAERYWAVPGYIVLFATKLP
jgi:hypothetical protein